MTQRIAAERRALIEVLQSFRRKPRDADVGIVYSTGHGVELNGVVYLVPGDYPAGEGFDAVRLREYAISVDRMIRLSEANGQNLIFFAGCRIAGGVRPRGLRPA